MKILIDVRRRKQRKKQAQLRDLNLVNVTIIHKWKWKYIFIKEILDSNTREYEIIVIRDDDAYRNILENSNERTYS